MYNLSFRLIPNNEWFQSPPHSSSSIATTTGVQPSRTPPSTPRNHPILTTSPSFDYISKFYVRSKRPTFYHCLSFFT
ncbi:hypothetical protein K440DRAFT_225996 [Wilcoxina mikolae CBS 423.85]|nr:hypothetical protein K440DRAFT_225996 [Wilcoxina mikolae CBS 423.85]